jgi:hypothetical protein
MQPARAPLRSWLARRSTMATSTPASASSPASISPVGPAPAIRTSISPVVIMSLPSIFSADVAPPTCAQLRKSRRMFPK